MHVDISGPALLTAHGSLELEQDIQNLSSNLDIHVSRNSFEVVALVVPQV
jgi:hypothetical protein